MGELRSTDLARAGGKGANLGELVAAGFAVPPGFVITTAAYREVVAGLTIPTHDTVAALEVPEAVRNSILEAYDELGAGRVAVRSSATAEDLPGAAFAGQQDTFLGIEGGPALLDAVRRCWGSLWTDRAISYRARLGIDDTSVAIAVVVQRMVPADIAGVMFTANPVTGVRGQVVIDSSPGLGEAVVSGLVTPDLAVLDARGQVVERSAGTREVVIREAAEGGTETVRASAARAVAAGRHTGDVDDPALSLSEADLTRLAEIGHRIATQFGRPQDIEWALAAGEFRILQARPMTALPPAPIRLNRFQRLIGPVILELLPRRPYPMEVSAWIAVNLGPNLEEMVKRLIGARFTLQDSMPDIDHVVQSYVPPNPVLSWRTPLRLLRTLGRTGRDPRAWTDDPDHRSYLAETTQLDAMDVSTLSWAELLGIPARAGDAGAPITNLRVGYLPAAAAAMVRLRILLSLLRRKEWFGSLVLEPHTMTQEANAELGEIARQLRDDPGLREKCRGLDGAQLMDLVETDPAARTVRAALEAFLARFGHRETVSILLPRDPTWSQSPKTVLALVAVLLDSDSERAPDSTASDNALARLLGHPLIRATRSAHGVRSLVRKASAAAALREDTHFELSRTMSIVRRTVHELGRRLADSGVLDAADDIWMLTLDELSRTGPDAADLGLRGIVERRRNAFAELAGSPLIAPTTLYPRLSSSGIEGVLVSGTGGGGGRVTGSVRIVSGPDEFATLRAGEVLVCSATNPSWTPLFARAAAVVVDNGGLASHAAIVAREYGIPAVMGTGNGTVVLTTGTRVQVDGALGVVLPGDQGR
ncbi:PEP/pyruvate-binding domain-containing protein [Cryobacterium sp. PH29-G1]|uniref:PEP/pyruvate-binding domain-containing protein n=1 Tax=Cryobacterium sp. PH29-G1 TaxID=3046211 RepID=UPI0024BA768E|nr:PEP/pyruvate-binding domain-containing protein [Cryobacterium sp. PH29-G1]MDJ0349341.1 PEP/pyruvate-binding domain-containing protein [Cryobacterium sp. PH29-G1]